jgi:hypothetical protein
MIVIAEMKIGETMIVVGMIGIGIATMIRIGSVVMTLVIGTASA